MINYCILHLPCCRCTSLLHALYMALKRLFNQKLQFSRLGTQGPAYISRSPGWVPRVLPTTPVLQAGYPGSCLQLQFSRLGTQGPAYISNSPGWVPRVLPLIFNKHICRLHCSLSFFDYLYVCMLVFFAW